MATDGDDRAKIVVYYAVWAALCALGAGVAIAAIHTAFFSYHPGRSGAAGTFVGDIAAASALAAGQGAVALVTGRLLARLGRTLHATVLLGLLVGGFDFAMYLVQMAWPATELGWTPDVLILAAAAALITVLGSRSSAATP
jgi:hypothetical protein